MSTIGVSTAQGIPSLVVALSLSLRPPSMYHLNLPLAGTPELADSYANLKPGRSYFLTKVLSVYDLFVRSAPATGALEFLAEANCATPSTVILPLALSSSTSLRIRPDE